MSMQRRTTGSAAWTATDIIRSDLAIIRTYPPVGGCFVPRPESAVNQDGDSVHRRIERERARPSTASTP
jgi:hypothetical protein